MLSKLGEPDVAAMNSDTLDRSHTLDDLMSACEAMPFLAEKRLVVARNFVSALGAAGKRKATKTEGDKAETRTPLDKLLDYLPMMNDATGLVFTEDDLLDEKHPLVRLAEAQGSGGSVKIFALPTDPVRWITDRAKAKGAEIHPQAATLLSTKINRGDKNDRDHVVMDNRTYLHKLDNELDKLVGYAMNRRIESKDVELLVAGEEVADIFKFIDAISVRNGSEAYRVVRGVINRGESPLVVLSHMARQFRVLIQIKDHPGMNSDTLAQRIGVHPYVAKKAAQQAGRFQQHELYGALEALLDADITIKTGRMDENTALDVLIAALCN
jgi:DNA polymerase-3 subunit delta